MERKARGSIKLFKALLESMSSQGKMAICRSVFVGGVMGGWG